MTVPSVRLVVPDVWTIARAAIGAGCRPHRVSGRPAPGALRAQQADERAADAQPYFDRGVTWLATAHPELGITADTAWEPIFVSTLLVVSHYSFWSAGWEMTIAWHNMIAPYDWTEVHLRQRGVDMAPSLAFRIDSVSESTEPHEVAPPEAVVR